MVILVFLLFINASATYEDCKEALISLEENLYPEGLSMLYFSGRDINDFGEYEKCIELQSTRYILAKVNVQGYQVLLGLCGPSECEAEDYKGLTSEALSVFNVDFPVENIQFVDIQALESKPMSTGTILAITLWVLLLLALLIGTAVEYFGFSGGVFSFFLAFSAISNGSKLFAIPTESSPLQVLNGIRVIGMLWVMLGHCYVFQMQGAVSNPQAIIDAIQSLPHKIIAIAFYYVDAFFWMAGFLVSYLAINRLKTKGIPWGMYILHRFFRIAPIYYFCLMNFVAVERWLSSGPQWINWAESREACQDSWWTNLLFLNNFIPPGEYPCMAWSWYIDNDMQLYLISPIMLILYAYNQILGHVFSGLLVVLNWAIIAGLTVKYDYTPGFLYGTSTQDEFIYYYIKPYTRLVPYVVGFVCGILYRSYVDSQSEDLLPSHRRREESTTSDIKREDVALGDMKKENLIPRDVMKEDLVSSDMQKENLVSSNIKKEELRSYRRSKSILRIVKIPIVRYLGYLLSILFLFICAFVTNQLDKHGPDYWTQESKILFIMFEHTLSTVAWTLLIVPMLCGHGRCLSMFLGHKYFAPLAKVSFTMYCFHPLLVNYYVFSRKQSVMFEDTTNLYHWFSTIPLTLMFSFLLFIMVENPVTHLEKRLLKHK